MQRIFNIYIYLYVSYQSVYTGCKNGLMFKKKDIVFRLNVGVFYLFFYEKFVVYSVEAPRWQRHLPCYPPTKSKGYSFGVVCAFVCPFRPSVRLHLLSVWNHISVPIGQI